MGTLAEAAGSKRNPAAAVLIVVLAVATGVAVLAVGKLALAGVLGLIAFCLFARYPVLGLYATTALLLLQGSSGLIGPVGSNVSIALTTSKLCGMAAFAAWLVNLLVTRKLYRLTWGVVLVVTFLLWSLGGVLFSENRSEQFPEWLRLGTIVGFFIMAVDILGNSERSAKYIHLYVILILLCGLISAAYAVGQYFMPGMQIQALVEEAQLATRNIAIIDTESLEGATAIRVSGRAQHSNWLALFILCVLPLNTYWFKVSKTRKGKTLVVASVAVELLALLLTFTRTGLLVGAILVLLLAAKRMVRPTLRRVLAAALALLMCWLILPEAYKQRVLSLRQYTRSQSSTARAELQLTAWKLMTRDPVWGVGLGGFGFDMIKELSRAGQTMKIAVEDFHWNPVFIGAHNLYLQLGCETGLVGLAVFLVLFAVVLRDLLGAERKFAALGDLKAKALADALEISLLAFLLCSVFLHALQQKIWWMVAALAIAVSVYAAALPGEPSRAADETGSGTGPAGAEAE